MYDVQQSTMWATRGFALANLCNEEEKYEHREFHLISFDCCSMCSHSISKCTWQANSKLIKTALLSKLRLEPGPTCSKVNYVIKFIHVIKYGILGIKAPKITVYVLS